MAELAAGVDRLTRAVNRLETAARANRKRHLGEQARLAAELAQAREEYAALSSVTDQVSNRLDGAIDRLKTVLDA